MYPSGTVVTFGELEARANRLAHYFRANGLREGDVVSGAYLAVDPGAEQNLYAALHARPRVLGMVANASAIRAVATPTAQSTRTT